MMTNDATAIDTIVPIIIRHYGKRHDEQDSHSVSWNAGKWTQRSSIHAHWRFSDMDINFGVKTAGTTTGQVDVLTPTFDTVLQKWSKDNQVQK